MGLLATPFSRPALRSLGLGDSLGSSSILLASRAAVRSANLASNAFYQSMFWIFRCQTDSYHIKSGSPSPSCPSHAAHSYNLPARKAYSSSSDIPDGLTLSVVYRDAGIRVEHSTNPSHLSWCDLSGKKYGPR